ncbi:MAG TPA: hypothetical protein VEA80_00915 [Vitreimonas sp.]|uniref:hypothetical protein n=1 Tax=Vitreimonas sp. TaxID=3069702 RepID=UPI002D24A2F2|nr:hypothetical protein [Vitreimonas sp.]HYD86012.1 hypothetical protein [Vitreimonas sp.]
MSTIPFIHQNDRKILTVVSEILAYAARELADLRASQPELSAAVESAHRISTALVGAADDADAAARREASI